MNEINFDLENLKNIPNFKNSITFFGSARLKKDSFYYQQAKILAKKLVDLMHGTINVQSSFGKGSIFLV